MPIHGDGGHAAVVNELPLSPPEGWIIAVGDNAIRKKEAKKYTTSATGYTTFAIGIHPSAVISFSATIGEGTVVLEGAIVQARAKIGRHVIINAGAVVTHDCVIEDFAHIAPGVHLCGGVRIGEGALVGVGSCAVPKAQVTQWSVIPAGSVIK